MLTGEASLMIDDKGFDLSFGKAPKPIDTSNISLDTLLNINTTVPSLKSKLPIIPIVVGSAAALFLFILFIKK